MEKSQQPGVLLVNRDDANVERRYFVVFAILFPVLMIYLNANGTDTGQVLQKGLGIITLLALGVGVIALIVALITRISAWLFRRSY